MAQRAHAKTHLLSCLALLTILGLQQAPALSVPFFADDYLFLDQVRHVDLATALQRPDPLGNFYRPLSRQVYFWALSHVGGESPRVAHAINLLLIAAIVLVLYFLVAWRWGSVSGFVAALPLSLSYALDVPARWGSGTQDLFAIAFALAAAHLFLSGRRWWAAAAYLCALWSKEVVLLLPAILLCLSWRPDERLRDATRRLAPLAVAALVWLVVWSARMARHLSAGASRASWASAAEGVASALAHLPVVVFGLEIGPHSPIDLASVAIAAGVLGLALLGLASVSHIAGSHPLPSRQALRLPMWRIGAVWILAGVLPIAWAASLWSAYYYCFALCGLGLLGAAVARGRHPRWVVALLVCMAAGSLWTRHALVYGIRTSPWTWTSHVSDAYIARSQGFVNGFDRSLRKALPSVPSHSTLFFGQVPGAIAWQTTDGPYVRWAYRDSTLRSYYLSELTDDRLNRGPVYLFIAEGDTLRNVSEDGAILWGQAFRAALQGDLAASRGYLKYAVGHGQAQALSIYLLAWALEGSRDHDAARTALAMINMPPSEAPGDGSVGPEVPQPRDSSEALALAERRVARDPWSAAAHAALADLYIHDRASGQRAMIEAYAARVLAPSDAWNWRRWAYTQAAWGEAIGALHSIDRYRQLSRGHPIADPGADRLEAALRRIEKGVNANGEVELNPSPF